MLKSAAVEVDRSSSDHAQLATFHIAGVNVAAIGVTRACEVLKELALGRKPAYVTVTGAHGIVESAGDQRIRDAHRQASLVVPDGMPLVWLGRLLGCKNIGRVYGPDLMTAVFARSDFRDLRHFFYGSIPAAVARLKAALTSRFGPFNLVGAHFPPMRPPGFQEDDEVIANIKALRPQVIWVGLSTPKQELWLNQHMPKIGSGVGVGVGAAFDLISGVTTQAPRWVQRSGFEWLFRLFMEPRRLFKRYAVVIPKFIHLFLVAVLDNRQGATLKRR